MTHENIQLALKHSWEQKREPLTFNLAKMTCELIKRVWSAFRDLLYTGWTFQLGRRVALALQIRVLKLSGRTVH